MGEMGEGVKNKEIKDHLAKKDPLEVQMEQKDAKRANSPSFLIP